MFPDLDYVRLRRSFEYFVEHYALAELIMPGSHPVKLLEQNEPLLMSRTKRALAVVIADFVEGTQVFCRERLTEIDRDLLKRDAHTLSFLRDHFTRETIGSKQPVKAPQTKCEMCDLTDSLAWLISFSL